MGNTETVKTIEDSPEENKCPICNKTVVLKGLYYCSNCLRWFEDIDFLDESEEVDEDCKKCAWLKKTEFKKNDQTLYYCNSPKSPRKMEKIRDFRKCKYIEIEDEK